MPPNRPGLPKGHSGRDALDIAVEAAMAAGGLIRERMLALAGGASASLKITHKGRNDFATDVDRGAEALVLGVLTAEFPRFGVLAEESGAHSGDAPYTWIVDPLDGTRNFVSGIPHFCVSIALARGDDVVAAVTLDPMRHELFRAAAGHGARLNDAPIHVSDAVTLESSILGFDMGYVDEKGRLLLEALLGIWPNMQTIRIMGSSALGMAYVAAGRLELYAHHHVSPWDMAAGLLLVREAGGVATNFEGEPAVPTDGRFIAAPPSIHDAFLKATAGASWRTSPQLARHST